MEPPVRRDRRSRRAALIRQPPAGAGGPLARTWPGLAVVGLLLVSGSILLFNQQHAGDPLKVRRELRKF